MRHPFRALALFITALILSFSSAQAAAPIQVDASSLVDDNAAAKAALCWLELVDCSCYDQSWYASGYLLKTKYSLYQWRDHLDNCRWRYGRSSSRAIVCSKEYCNPSGLPCGKYYVTVFKTKFSNCDREYYETLTLRWARDCAAGRRWKVIYYVITPCAESCTESALDCCECWDF